MSAKFTKILTYVVLAVTIVVIVVCAAVLLSSGSAVQISVDTHYISRTAADNDVVVKINGEQTNKLNVKEGSTVTLTFESMGYDFRGWFGGNAGEWSTAAEAVETEVSYTFTANENTELTAAFDATQYVVNFTGIEGVAGDTFTYGEQLPTASATGTEVFLGWKQSATSTEFVTTMPAASTKTVTFEAVVVDYADYNFLFQVPATDYSTAGTIQYTVNTGVNVESAAMNPQRDYYNLSAVVLNEKTFEFASEDVTSQIANELLSMDLINASNYQSTDISVPATVKWTCVVTSLTLDLDAPYNGLVISAITVPTDSIETLVISEQGDFSSYEKDRFQITEVAIMNGNSYFENETSWATATVKDIFDVLVANGETVSGNMTIEISIDAIQTAA